MALPEEYRDFFIRNLHDALSGHTSSSVSEAVRYSERSKVKCVGITIETRPDYCLKRHLSDMLAYGCTRYTIQKNKTIFNEFTPVMNHRCYCSELIQTKFVISNAERSKNC